MKLIPTVGKFNAKKLIFIYHDVVLVGLHQVLYIFLRKRLIDISQNNHFFGDERCIFRNLKCNAVLTLPYINV